MSVLPETGLRTIEEGSIGNAQVLSDNFEDIDDKLRGPFKASTRLGDLTVANGNANNAQSINDNTTGTATDTINDVGATYNQATLNNIFASLIDEINKLKSDRDTLQTKLNELIGKLRKTGGCGVLDD